jgi:hypothetical protein
MNWTVVAYLFYIAGSLCFIGGSIIGLLLSLKVIK